MSQVENWFASLGSRMTESVKVFSASLFLLMSVGMIYGIYFAALPSMLLLLPILAVLAYYSRTFALAVLALVIIAFIW